MHIEVSGRQAGKTTKMLDEVLKNPNAVIVVHSRLEARRIEGLLDERFNRWRFWREHYLIHSWEEHISTLNWQGMDHPEQPVYLDNIDLILSRYGVVWTSASSEES